MSLTGGHRRERRAASTLIAGVFMILMILSGFSLYLLATRETELYRSYTESVDRLLWERSREEVAITGVSRVNGKLNLTIENEGPATSHITWLGVFNQTASPPMQSYYSLNTYINPGETLTNIGSTVVLKQDASYVIQILTDKGNVAEYSFYDPSKVKCRLFLLVVPKNVTKGETIAVQLIVTHNASTPDSIQSITPSLTATPGGIVTLWQSPNPAAINNLRKGDSAFFKWLYNATGTGMVTFNATYQNAPVGTYALAPAYVNYGQAGSITITGPSTIPYNSMTNYYVQVYSANGKYGPFIIVVYCDGTAITPPKWMTINSYFTDVNGYYVVNLKSTVTSTVTFNLYVTCGTVAEIKTITQTYP